MKSSFIRLLALLPMLLCATGALAGATSLSLTEARALALANDEQILQISEAVAAARFDALGARSDKLPQLNLGLTYARNLKKPAFFLPADMASAFGGESQIEMGGDYDLQGAATLTLNLWTSGRLSAAAGMADAALSATAWQQALVQDAVLYGVDTAYFDALLATAQVDIASSAVIAAEEALRVTAAAYDQGTASRFDHLRAKVELANRQAPLVQAQNMEDLAKLTLQRLCGLAANAAIMLTDQLEPGNAPGALNTLLAEMNEASAELQSLRQAKAIRRQAVRLAKAGRGPVVQLQGQYAVQGQWDDDILPGDDEAARSASVSLGVSIPVFDGFKTKAEIGRSEAELRQAEVELERVTRNRELGVRQARIFLMNALTALDGRQESVDLALEAHRLALVRLENGLATPLERLSAELALTDARTQLAQTLHNCNTARAALTLAVGTHQAPTDEATEDKR